MQCKIARENKNTHYKKTPPQVSKGASQNNAPSENVETSKIDSQSAQRFNPKNKNNLILTPNNKQEIENYEQKLKL